MKLSFCGLAGLLLLVGCASGTPKTAEVPAMPDLSTVSTMLQEGTLTSESLVNELLKRIDQQAELNAFISINPEVAVIWPLANSQLWLYWLPTIASTSRA